jgi:hypothetical protein
LAWRRQDRYIKTLSIVLITKAENQNLLIYLSLEQLKFKKTTALTKNSTNNTERTLDNYETWFGEVVRIESSGGDLLKVTNENIRYGAECC